MDIVFIAMMLMALLYMLYDYGKQKERQEEVLNELKIKEFEIDTHRKHKDILISEKDVLKSENKRLGDLIDSIQEDYENKKGFLNWRLQMKEDQIFDEKKNILRFFNEMNKSAIIAKETRIPRIRNKHLNRIKKNLETIDKG